MRFRIIAIFCVYSLVAASPAFARFLVTDADQIDPEERLNSESYNDIVSYRFPVSWDWEWDLRDLGYRVSAGSLNVNRFDYIEDIKFAAAIDQPLGFAFSQSRHEDTVEQRTEREARLSYKPGDLFRYSLLGDGGTYKEYGDLGCAIAINPERDRLVELYYWSVDHYYQTKKSDQGDRRTRSTSTVGMRGDWRLNEGLRTRLNFQVDHPLRWERPSRGYVYDYARRTLDYRLDGKLANDVYLYFSGRQEWKEEAKLWITPSGLAYEKRLKRKISEHELGFVLGSGERNHSLGLLYIERDADYRFRADPGLNSEEFVESPGPNASRRREVGAYEASYFPLSSGQSYLQVGGNTNAVRIAEDGLSKRWETKAQLAYEYRFDAKARMLLNTTWDLDQIGRDFPYDERSFSPWGGGDIQFLAAF